MNNIKYKDSIMRNMYFEENKHKKLEIENSDLTGANFFRTSLKDIDLSSDNISALVVGLYASFRFNRVIRSKNKVRGERCNRLFNFFLKIEYFLEK